MKKVSKCQNCKSQAPFWYLVDPGNLVGDVGDPFLDGADVLDVLLHHVQLAIVVELVHACSQLLKLHHDLLPTFHQALLSLLLRLLNQLRTGRTHNHEQ